MINDLIIQLEDRILAGHLTSDPSRRLHTCKFCGKSNNWHVNVEHDPSCAISILAKIRKELQIPNWFERITSKEYLLEIPKDSDDQTHKL
jgi:hypothetical protein